MDLGLVSVVNWAFQRIKLGQYVFLKLPLDYNMSRLLAYMQMEIIVPLCLVSSSDKDRLIIGFILSLGLH